MRINRPSSHRQFVPNIHSSSFGYTIPDRILGVLEFAPLDCRARVWVVAERRRTPNSSRSGLFRSVHSPRRRRRDQAGSRPRSHHYRSSVDHVLTLFSQRIPCSHSRFQKFHDCSWLLIRNKRENWYPNSNNHLGQIQMSKIINVFILHVVTKPNQRSFFQLFLEFLNFLPIESDDFSCILPSSLSYHLFYA